MQDEEICRLLVKIKIFIVIEMSAELGQIFNIRILKKLSHITLILVSQILITLH